MAIRCTQTIVGLMSAWAIAFGLSINPVLASEENWTVLTMAPDGAWGAATEPSTNRAIAGAIAQCRATSQAALGCGASFTSIRAGWSLGVRCGSENIIVAARSQADAERAAHNREMEMRHVYMIEMEPCRRVVTIDPNGAVTAAASVARAPKADPRAQRQVAWAPNRVLVGIHDEIDDVREALGRAGMKVGDQAKAILRSSAFSLNATEAEVQLVVASVADLGFGDEGASLGAVHARARSLGLELCPAEVGPQLRLRYRNQPVGEWLRVAMAPIATDDGGLADFTLGNGGEGQLLIGSDAHPDVRVSAMTQFVFAVPQPGGSVIAKQRDGEIR